MYSKMKLLVEASEDLDKAQNPMTNAEELESLSKHADSNVQKAVASNPNISFSLYKKLARDYPEESYANPATFMFQLENPDFWEHFTHKHYNSFRDTHIKNQLAQGIFKPNSDEHGLELIKIGHKDALNHPLLLKNPSLIHNFPKTSPIPRNMTYFETAHPSLLDALADSRDEEFRFNVASNPSALPSTLEKLSNEENIRILAAVARNHNTHPETLDKLHNHSDSYVRGEVASNPKTNGDTLHKLSQDPDNEIINSVAGHENTHPHTLERLIKSTNPYTRRNIALNPNVSSDLLHKLSSDPDLIVKHNVATHENTHPDTLDQLADEQYDPTYGLHSKIVAHPNTSAATLHKLKDLGIGYIRSQIASHPNTDPETLHSLSDDDYAPTREALVDNANTPLHTLKKLARDRSPYISKQAQKNLASRK